MPRSKTRRSPVAYGLGILGLAALLAGCGAGQVEPVTEQGNGLHGLYLIVFWMGFAIFAIVEIAIFYMAIRYRRRKQDDESLPPQIHGNDKLEILWTTIPAIIVIVLFVLSWIQITNVQEVSADPGMRVEVQGFQWQWTFSYPDETLSNGEPVQVAGVLGEAPPTLVVPVDTVIQMSLKSEDVIHSFYIPQALYKLDVVPGLDNKFDITFDEVGRFRGQCAELCGLSHAQMVFFVEVVTQDDFRAWMTKTRTAAEREASGGDKCKPEGTKVEVAAKNVKFDKECLAAPAGTPFQIVFDNQEAIDHNVAIYQSEEAQQAGEAALFQGEIFKGPKEVTYDVDPIPAGKYYFVCDVHPTAMKGTFNIGEPEG